MEQQVLENYVQELFESIPGVISVSVVSTADGSVLAYRGQSGVDNRKASSYQVEIFRNAVLSFENTEGLKNKAVDDVSLVYDGQTHVITVSQNKKLLDHVVLDDTANLVMAKMIISKLKNEMFG